MRGPRLIRPLFLFGAIVLGIAIFSLLLSTSWRSSPVGITILVIAGLVGLAAIVKDMLDFAKEVKEFDKTDKID